MFFFYLARGQTNAMGQYKERKIACLDDNFFFVFLAPLRHMLCSKVFLFHVTFKGPLYEDTCTTYSHVVFLFKNR